MATRAGRVGRHHVQPSSRDGIVDGVHLGQITDAVDARDARHFQSGVDKELGNGVTQCWLREESAIEEDQSALHADRIGFEAAGGELRTEIGNYRIEIDAILRFAARLGDQPRE